MDHIITGQCSVTVFDEPMQAISWAYHGGGLRDGIRAVVNWSVADDMKTLEEYSKEVFTRLDLLPNETVVLLTAVPAQYCFKGCASDYDTGLTVWASATAGLGNLRAFDDEPEWNEEMEQGVPASPGTINIVVSVNRRLSLEARIELLAMIAQVKTHIVESYALSSPLGGDIASATGTDCIVLCNHEMHETTLRYAGMHTTLRHVTAQAVKQALQGAIINWLRPR